MDDAKDLLLLILERLGSVEQRLEQVYQDLDRDVLNLHTDLTNFSSEAGAHFAELHQDAKWLTEKWVQHDKQIERLKAAK